MMTAFSSRKRLSLQIGALIVFSLLFLTLVLFGRTGSAFAEQAPVSVSETELAESDTAEAALPDSESNEASAEPEPADEVAAEGPAPAEASVSEEEDPAPAETPAGEESPAVTEEPAADEAVPVEPEPADEASSAEELEPVEEAESEIEEEPEEETEPETKDTAAPVLRVYAAAVKLGKNVLPTQFVKSCHDDSNVTIRFAEKPDTNKIGEYEVTIVAEDEFGNTTEKTTKLYVCDRLIELELESEVKVYSGLKLREFVGTLHGYKPSIEYYKVKREGATSFLLTKGDKTIHVGIQVRDTKRPKASPVDRVCYLGYSYKAEDFVTAISDVQDVTISFMEEPDWNEAGSRNVRIAVTDESGNRRIVKAKVTFQKDDVPPEIKADVDIYHYVGDAVAYMKGVSAKDNMDPNCEITVDKSAVKYRRVGTYPVTYTATDRDGNSSSTTVQLHFIEPAVTDEQLDELADSILSEILKDNMSVCDQIKAIYDYCRYKIRYTGSSDKTDWKGEAYRGLTEFKGDCFTYYSAAYLLLNKIDGVEVLSVERIGGKTHHYWCLVNVGTGWYHYDACPNHIFGTCFMRTNDQLHHGDGKAYWKYAEADFPEVASQAFKMF